nr:ABC transporter permease [Colwellia sp.]
MNIKRFFAVFKARNIEFFRDKSSLSWNLIFPILLLVGFSFIFSGDGRSAYKVGLVDNSAKMVTDATESMDSVINSTVNSTVIGTVNALTNTRFIDYIYYENIDSAKAKLSRHTIDLVIDDQHLQYWVNEQSSKSYLAERVFSEQLNGYARLETSGKKIRYIDWVLTGILAMNIMFSCLYGVGYAIVRYRKNSVLKRLKATPLSAFEFVSAQLLSRLFIVMCMSVAVYSGCNVLFDFFMLGSYIDLFIVGLLGAFCLISLGLLVASRSKSEELIGGLLNLTSWPMMMLSGVWFS